MKKHDMSQISKSKENLTRVVGYVSDREVGDLSRRKEGTADIQFEAGSDKVVFRVKRSEIQQVVPGASTQESRHVQVFLTPGAHVETQIRVANDVRNLEDPSLLRLTSAAVSTVSSLGGTLPLDPVDPAGSET